MGLRRLLPMTSRADHVWMKEAGLTTPPIIESNRSSNEFDLVLLLHHLLDQQGLEWLAQFATMKLSDAERRALVLLREMGAMINQDYRQVNGVDTFAASRALTHLRDLGLLTIKASSSKAGVCCSKKRFMNRLR